MRKSSLWLLALLAIVLKLTLFNRIEIWGIRPDSTVIILVYVALSLGPLAGALFGFLVGLAEFGILSTAMPSMPLAGALVGFAVGRYGGKTMHDSALVQMFVIFVAVVMLDVVNFAWYDPGRLLFILTRYTLLGGIYTALAGIIMVFIVRRIMGVRLAS
jgi:rod shape-determining protein MreD